MRERWVLSQILKTLDPPLLGQYEGTPEFIPSAPDLRLVFDQLQIALNSSSLPDAPDALGLPPLRASVITVSRSVDDGFTPSDLW
jgi:hypothetical protein